MHFVMRDSKDVYLLKIVHLDFARAICDRREASLQNCLDHHSQHVDPSFRPLTQDIAAV